MKRKVFALVAIVCMLSMLWTGIPVGTANPEIKVGVIRPIGVAEGMGTEGGCKVAQWWINGESEGVTGTPHPIVINGQPYDVKFIYEDEHAVDMRPDLAAAAAEKLITVDDVDFIIGGTMDECWYAVQEVCADRETLCINTGCTWYRLMDCGYGTPFGDPTPCGACIRCDYERYKYIFRTGPCNSTLLAFVILNQISWVLTDILLNVYGAPIKTAIICEDLDWNVELHDLLLGGEVLPPELVNIVYSARTPFDCANFMPYLDELKASGANLLITFYYMEAGATLIMQLDEYPGHIPVLVTGALVPAQMQEFWDMTGGECEFVTTMTAAGGTRSPVVTVPAPVTSVEFWDKFLEINGFTPTHNGYCVFDTMMMMKEVLEAAGIDPPLDPAKTDALIPYIELVDRQGIRGKFKFTCPNPGHNGDFSDYDPDTSGNQPYPYSGVNPTMKGTLHDVWGPELGETWTLGYIRPWLVQWQAGKMVIVHPKYAEPGKLLPFWRRCVLPPWMYPYPLDLTYDGYVDMRDISLAARSFGSYPCHPRYDMGAARIIDDYPPGYEDEPVSMRDISKIARAFGTTYPLPLP